MYQFRVHNAVLNDDKVVSKRQLKNKALYMRVAVGEVEVRSSEESVMAKAPSRCLNTI